MNTAHIKATGIPESLEQYQLALDCAVAAGQASALAKLTAGVAVPDLRDFAISDRAHIELIAAFHQYGASQRLAGQQRETCTWTEQDDKDMPGTYTSSCGEMWSFIEGGLKENRVTYCQHCGGKVVPASPQEQT